MRFFCTTVWAVPSVALSIVLIAILAGAPVPRWAFDVPAWALYCVLTVHVTREAVAFFRVRGRA